MTKQSVRESLHTMRTIASFALLGAVSAGVIFGWADVDLRPWGAAIGGSSAIALKLLHIL